MLLSLSLSWAPGLVWTTTTSPHHHPHLTTTSPPHPHHITPPSPPHHPTITTTNFSKSREHAGGLKKGKSSSMLILWSNFAQIHFSRKFWKSCAFLAVAGPRLYKSDRNLPRYQKSNRVKYLKIVLFRNRTSWLENTKDYPKMIFCS